MYVVVSRNHKILIPLFILTIGALGCSLLTNRVKEPEVIAVTTAVGTPNGTATTQSIGPAGGSIATADGRLTLKIPQNALSSTVNVTIQPITDQSPGGLGKAYRLEPNGQTFGTPVEVSFRYDDKDLAGTSPEALDVAYQDAEGFWRVFQSVNRDQANKTLTVTTTHFTDFTTETLFQLVPNRAVVRVGKSVELVLNSCGRKDFIDKLFKLSGSCLPVSTLVAAVNWTVNGTSGNSTFGTVIDSVKDAMTGGTYTAPVKKPEPNVVTVRTDIQYKFHPFDTGVWAFALITIVDGGYRATGSEGPGPTTYSGTICSLDKEFTVVGHNGPLELTFKFTPSGDGRTGTGTLGGAYSVANWTGGGPYTIEGFGSDKPKIVWVTHQTVSGKISGSGTFHIDLVPLDTDECK